MLKGNSYRRLVLTRRPGAEYAVPLWRRRTWRDDGEEGDPPPESNGSNNADDRIAKLEAELESANKRIAELNRENADFRIKKKKHIQC